MACCVAYPSSCAAPVLRAACAGAHINHPPPCPRSEPRYEWRVYDVCAVMRQQKERKVQAKLDRPVKKSHHFFESSD